MSDALASPIACPKCNKPGAFELFDEVDIGVGIMRRCYGFECADCGNIALCSTCGQPDFLPHNLFCPVIKEMIDKANEHNPAPNSSREKVPAAPEV